MPLKRSGRRRFLLRYITLPIWSLITFSYLRIFNLVKIELVCAWGQNHWWLDILARFYFLASLWSEISAVIVNKAEWLGSPANIKGANKDAKIYVGRSTTLHNLLFCAHTLCMNYVTNTFLLVRPSVRSKQLLCFLHGQGQKSEQKPTTKNSLLLMWMNMYLIIVNTVLSISVFIKLLARYTTPQANMLLQNKSSSNKG